ncbi:MAG: C40 family peptidase [candidate division FCPU426 bacterium]
MRTTFSLLRRRAVLTAWVAGCAVAAGGCAAVRPLPANPAAVERVVQLATSLQGKPYRYGGTTPAGFDCSGLVQYVFRQAAGVALPRTSRRQFAATRHVPLGGEEPADLLFFDINGRGISHVGIYLGKGRFVHAPSSGGEVKISDANEPYWRSRFRGVHRVLR